MVKEHSSPLEENNIMVLLIMELLKEIFFWDDGCRWEGTFSNYKLHGDGVFYNPRNKTSFNVSYKNNRIVEEGSREVLVDYMVL